jgi:hypothetical protein
MQQRWQERKRQHKSKAILTPKKGGLFKTYQLEKLPMPFL